MVHAAPALEILGKQLQSWTVAAMQLNLLVPVQQSEVVRWLEEELVRPREGCHIGKKLDLGTRRCLQTGTLGSLNRLDLDLASRRVDFNPLPVIRTRRSLPHRQLRLLRNIKTRQQVPLEDRKQLRRLVDLLPGQADDEPAALLGPRRRRLRRARDVDKHAHPHGHLVEDLLGPGLVRRVVEQRGHAPSPGLDASRDDDDKVGLVCVEGVQLGDKEGPFWLDHDGVAEQLLQAAEGCLEGAVLLGPVVADADLGFERSVGWLVVGVKGQAGRGVIAAYSEGMVQVGVLALGSRMDRVSKLGMVCGDSTESTGQAAPNQTSASHAPFNPPASY